VLCNEPLGWGAVSTPLHEARLDAVLKHVLVGGVETVLDLGCGSGALLERLVSGSRLRRIVGIDPSPRALHMAESRLRAADGTMDERLSLRLGSATAIDPDIDDIDAAVLVEPLEHIDPAELSRFERSIFTRLRPGRVILTTPNREYNVLHGFEDGEYRHLDHRFEWDRRKFQRWATGVARRNRYDVVFEGIGPGNAWFGNSTQMAVFHLKV
jgi:small RNA 2'-O-methyltransferase